ncbi:MAG: hypothetical protein Q8N89_14310 [Azonexus sp.]|nr:hypothetical protein [Azonexus sp.]
MSEQRKQDEIRHAEAAKALTASAFIHPLGDSATRLLARLLGRPTWSLLLAGMSLLRRRFAPVIPPRRPSATSN